MSDEVGISFITTFTKVRLWSGEQVERRASRCIGFLHNMQEAIDAVKGNAGDMNEAGTYPLCVVETLAEGIYPHAISTTWFEWDKDLEAYREIEQCPEDLEGTAGFSLG